MSVYHLLLPRPQMRSAVVSVLCLLAAVNAGTYVTTTCRGGTAGELDGYMEGPVTGNASTVVSADKTAGGLRLGSSGPGVTMKSLINCKFSPQSQPITSARLELTVSSIVGSDPLNSNGWTATGPTTVVVDMVRFVLLLDLR